jgi:phage gp36-like protein
MAYSSQTDLENALGVNIVKAIFDDNLDGVVDVAPMAACLAYGDAECNSFLRGTYDATFPIDPVPDELKFAAVDFCCAYAARRRPDLTRAMGEAPWTTFREAAVEKMKLFIKSTQRLPPTVAVPSNVGAEIVAPIDTATNEVRARTFDDFGDF